MLQCGTRFLVKLLNVYTNLLFISAILDRTNFCFNQIQETCRCHCSKHIKNTDSRVLYQDQEGHGLKAI